MQRSSVRVAGKQLSKIENVTKFYKSREEVIKFYNDYFKMAHKSTYDAKHGKRLEISTPKKRFKDYQELLHN